MNKVWKILQKKQTSVGSAAMILMSMVFASRVLGLIRDRLLASRFVPEELGVYFAAFRLPNLLFELLVMGVLTTAFIPVFTKYLTQQKEAMAWKMAATLINVTTLILFLFALPILIWTEQISRILAPGFSPAQITEMAIFTRIMILSQLLPLLVGNFFTGILQSYNLFFIPALAPVVYNIGIIFCIIVLSPTFGLYAPVIGIGVGAALFMLIQVPLVLSVGYRHRLSVDPKIPGVGEVLRLMAPRTLGLAISQIDTTVDLMLATLLGARMVTIFNFAQHLQQLPIGLFGATIAQAALPSLSVASVKEDKTRFSAALISAMHQILFFVLPVSSLFIVLRIPIVRLVFGASRFDWSATVLTGMTLSFFSISLFAQSAIHVLARGFYALYDSRTPVIIGVLSIIINTVLSVLFISVYHFPVWALGLSTTVASIFNAVFLLIFLDRRIGGFDRKQLYFAPFKMIIAAGIMGIMLYVPLKLLDQLVFDTTRTFNLLFLTGITSLIGMLTYAFLSWVFGVGEVHTFIAQIKRVRRAGAIILEPAKEALNGGENDRIT